MRINKLIILMFFVLLSSNALAIGAGPSVINFDGVLKGGYAEKLVKVSNNVNKSAFVTASFNGEIKDWLYVKEGMNFTISNSSYKEITVLFRPPSDVLNKNYNSTIKFLFYYDDQNKTYDPNINNFVLSITTGIVLDIRASVTGEQRIGYNVLDINMQKDAEESYPFVLTIRDENSGNVRTKSNIIIDIYDYDKTKILKTFSFEGNELLPTQRVINSYNISTSELKSGQYYVDTKIMFEGKLVKEYNAYVEVFPKGTLRTKGVIELLTTDKVRSNAFELVTLNVAFKNIGEDSINAIFKGTVYLGNDVVDLVESDKISGIKPGESANLTFYYKPKKEGRYVIDGYVIYSGKKTEPKQVILNVSPGQEPLITNEFIAVIVILLIIAGVFLWNKKKPEKVAPSAIKSMDDLQKEKKGKKASS